MDGQTEVSDDGRSEDRWLVLANADVRVKHSLGRMFAFEMGSAFRVVPYFFTIRHRIVYRIDNGTSRT